MPRNNRNRPEVPSAENVLDKFKYEIAAELGVPDYANMDKGDLPARTHGKIGGNMVKRMIMFAQNQMLSSNGQIPPQGDLNQMLPNSQ